MTFFLKLMLFLSTALAISTSGWFTLWVFMEMNTMVFISMANKQLSPKKLESMLKYFLVQTLSAIIILMSFLILKGKEEKESMLLKIFDLNLLMGILLKLGMIPFHMWMPPIMKQMGWFAFFILLTWMKIIPLYLLILTSNKIIILIALISVIFSTLFQLIDNNLKTILVFSSIAHMAWISILSTISFGLMSLYFTVYSLILSQLTGLLKTSNFKMLTNNLISMSSKSSIMILLLSLGGIPPFLGFLPKWLALNMMIYAKMIFAVILFIMMASLNFYIYLRMTYYILNKNNQSSNNRFGAHSHQNIKIIISQSLGPSLYFLA